MKTAPSGPPFPWLTEQWDRLERAIEQERLGHALLVRGAPGLGKSRLAEALVQRVLIPGPGTGRDDNGRFTHPDLVRVSPEEDKNTISVDQVRPLANQLALTSHAGGAKAAIIEPAASMTPSAANSLLKTLEEPPGHSLIVLVSGYRHGLPATVISRCQHIHVSAPANDLATAWLREQRPDEQWQRLLDFAGGAPLRALALATSGFSDVDHKLGADLAGIIDHKVDPVSVAAAWAKKDPALCLDWLGQQVSGAIRAIQLGDIGPGVRQEALDRLKKAGPGFTLADAYRYLDAVRDTASRLDGSMNKPLAMQALLVAWSSGLDSVQQLYGRTG